MQEIQSDVRSAIRRRLVERGAAEYREEEIFERVRALLQQAIARGDLLLPDLLGDANEWSLDPVLRLSTHRGGAGRAILFVKERVLLPLTRWLFEYTQSNLRRQERLNRILLAC